jgi:hypothetical protein
MKLTRRQLGQSLAAGLALPPAQENTWTIGNEAIGQTLAFEHSGLRCVSLRHRKTAREWIHPALPSEEMLVSVGDPPVAVSGKGPLRLLRQARRSSGVWNELLLEFELPGASVTLTRRYLHHATLPVIRQQTILRNSGGKPVTVSRCDAFRLRVGPSPEPLELHWINNFGRAMMPEPGNPIHHASVDDNSRCQVRSGPYSPDFGWFALTQSRLGEGLVGGWEWSGPMTVEFGDRRDPCLIHGGWDAEGLAEPLEPGATLAGPMGWYGFFEGGLDEAAHLSHQLVEALAPPIRVEGAPWVGYCTWSASLDEKSPFNAGAHPWFPTERNLLGQVEAAAALGFDMYLWDYGWFPRVGDWHCDPRRFPNGPGTVVRAVKKAGMKLGLWIGFGNADDDSEVVREHRGWLATYGGEPIPDRFFTRTAASVWKTRTLCLAHRPAREWVKEQLARVIDSFELDWLKHDFDLITICQDRHHTHTPGDSRVASCAAFYEIMDFVRSRWPNLLCENWMNNSAVPDYGVIQRHHVQLIGDAYQPFQLRQMFYGHVQVYPPDRQHRYLRFEDGHGDFLTMMRSGSIGGPLTILSDPRRMSEGQRRILKEEIARYRANRHLLVGARVSRLLGRPHPRAWDAVQFWRPDLRQGLVYVFRGDHPQAERTVPLRHLEGPETVRAVDLDTGAWHSVTNAALRVSLPKPGTCALFRLER